MPEEQDADAIARGDIIPQDGTAATSPGQQETAGPASADPVDGVETPSSAPGSDPQGGEATADSDSDAVAAKTDDKASDDDVDHRVPKARFDQAVNKERDRAAAAEAELQKYRAREAQQTQAANFEESQKKVKEMLKEHSSLLADGDLDKASDVMEQVLQLRDDMTQARAQAMADNARNSAKNEVRYDATVERIEADYPEINPDAEEFDETAVRRVQAMVTGIMQTEGKDAATALIEATDILLKPAKEARETQTLREKPSEEAVEQGLRRTQAQIDKNLKTADSQPPATKDVGKDHDATGGALNATAVSQMSWEEFIAVPDSELSKMRGDLVN